MYYIWRMAPRNGKELLSAWVEASVAQRFKAVARASDGSVSQSLARMVGEAIGDPDAVSPSGVGQSEKLTVRFRREERAALASAARLRATTPANWVRSLVIVHLMRRPQWSDGEREELRALTREVRRIGSNVNQIARAMNEAAKAGQCSADAAVAANNAAQQLHSETRRLGAVLTGNFDYWGLPGELHPRATREGISADEERQRWAKAKRRLRPKLRPARFKDDQ